jgi:protein tyrosine/serine phosphatase
MDQDFPHTPPVTPSGSAPVFGNFRDFGGFSSAYRGQVKRHVLFRSGHLAVLDDTIRAELLAMDFALIVDLRYEAERLDEPSPWPQDWDERIIYPHTSAAADAPHVAVMRSGVFDEAGVCRFYEHYYREMVMDPPYQQVFAEYFQRLANTEGKVLVHCSAGKDRTGLLVALTQHILGVAPADIMADFLQSNHAGGIEHMTASVERRLQEKLGKKISPVAVLKMLQVDASYLTAALTRMHTEFGGIDQYLAIQLGVDQIQQRQLRQRFLQTAP